MSGSFPSSRLPPGRAQLIEELLVAQGSNVASLCLAKQTSNLLLHL